MSDVCIVVWNHLKLDEFNAIPYFNPLHAGGNMKMYIYFLSLIDTEMT